jgi:hypothetical protein
MDDTRKFALSLIADDLTPAIVQSKVEQALVKRLVTMPFALRKVDGSPSARALQEQAAFLSGAGAALQAVFQQKHKHDVLTEFFSPAWVFSVIRGEFIVEVPK